MKLIFLDYDGVLLNVATKYRTADSLCVKWLNVITEATNAKIVVSSTWRHDGLNINRERLRGWGVTGEVIGITPDLAHYQNGVWLSIERGKEIKRWMIDRPELDVERFVILDDDADMGELMPHLVQTTPQSGIVMYDVGKALEMLLGENYAKHLRAALSEGDEKR